MIFVSWHQQEILVEPARIERIQHGFAWFQKPGQLASQKRKTYIFLKGPVVIAAQNQNQVVLLQKEQFFGIL